MKNQFKLINFIKILFLIFIVFTINSVNTSSSKRTQDDIKNFSNITVKDEFADDKILVVLNSESSLSNKNYDKDDFNDLNCIKVEDLTSSATSKVRMKLQNEFGFDLNKSYFKNYRRILSIHLKEKSKENILKVIEELNKRSDIDYAGPDYILNKFSSNIALPNDSYIQEQWALTKIEVQNAWNITVGNSDTLVGIMDTGIDSSHPELTDVIETNLCRDFTGENPEVVVNPIDFDGHGTHVAGIIGAVGNNNLGITGICWNIKLVSLRFFGINNNSLSSYVFKAIDFASENNIKILNLSGGWYSSDHSGYNYVLKTAIEGYPGIVICAAGNRGQNNDDENPALPASYVCNNLISVGASNYFDSRLIETNLASNYGKQTVDLFAPGRLILSTMINGDTPLDFNRHSNGYAYADGTSMAAPHVAGVAALMLSINPNLTPIEIKKGILENVDKNLNLENLCVSGGRLNAYKAVRFAERMAATTLLVN